MARIPTKEEVKLQLVQAKADDEAKKAAQKEEGKGFQNSGQGVIPEEVWQNLPGKAE